MNTSRQPRIAAFAFAFVLTLALFSGVAHLAQPTPAAQLLAQSLTLSATSGA